MKSYLLLIALVCVGVSWAQLRPVSYFCLIRPTGFRQWGFLFTFTSSFGLTMISTKHPAQSVSLEIELPKKGDSMKTPQNNCE